MAEGKIEMNPGGIIFNGFNAHDDVEILWADHVLGMLSFKSTSDGRRHTLPMRCGSHSRSALQEGRMLPVQYGTITAAEATGDRARQAGIRKGDRKISAIRHLSPRITPLGLSLMRWALGDELCAAELARYRSRAATTQTEALFTGARSRTPVRLALGGGCITPSEVEIGGARLSVQGVHVATGAIPDTLLAAMIGRDVGAVIAHDALLSGGRISQATNNAGTVYIHLEPTTIDVDDAIRMTAARRAA